MPDFPTSLVEFQRQSRDDDACAAWLLPACWPSGFMFHMRLRQVRAAWRKRHVNRTSEQRFDLSDHQ